MVRGLMGFLGFLGGVGMGFGRSSVWIDKEDSSYYIDLLVVAKGAAFLFLHIFVSLLLPLTQNSVAAKKQHFQLERCRHFPPILPIEEEFLRRRRVEERHGGRRRDVARKRKENLTEQSAMQAVIGLVVDS